MEDRKIFYYAGKNMDLKSKILPGVLHFAEDALEIYSRDSDGHHGPSDEERGEPEIRIAFSDILSPSENYRLHFLCRMLRVHHREGAVFFTVPLIAAAGRPVVSNSTQLVAIQDELDRRFRTAWLPSGS